MMRFRSPVTYALLALALALVVAACGGDTDAPDQATTDTSPETPTDGDGPRDTGSVDIEELVIATSTLAGLHMDPLTVTQFYKVHLDPLFDYLVGSDESGALDGDRGLAEDWQQLDDSRGWIFTLREGVTFSNGDPVTAEDLAFQLERVLDPEVGAGSHALFAGIVEAVEVLDDRRVQVTTTDVDILLPFLLSNHGLLEGYLMPKDYYLSLGDDEETRSAEFIRAPIGTGPYTLVESVPGSHALYQARDDYWGGTPRFQRLRLVEVAEEATRVAALQRGEVHIIEASRNDAQQLADAGFVLHAKEGGATMGLVMHEQWFEDNPLSQLEVRQAINHAIDRQTILDTLFLGQGRPIHTWRIGTNSVGYQPGEPPAYDPDRARDLLAEAGQDGFSLTLLGFERQGLPEAREMMEAITGMLQAVGIQAELEWTDQGVVFETWFSYPEHETQSPMYERWGASVSMNNTGNNTLPHQTAQFVWSENGLARITTDSELARLAAAWNRVQTEDEYAEITIEAQKRLVETSTEIAMFELDDLFASVPEITQVQWLHDVYQFSFGMRSLLLGPGV
jgi:peptide/nickel transport system substrate-binding protein